MAALSIEIFNCSVVLYRGTSPIEAHAGSSFSITKWIDEQLSILGNVHVTGWHMLERLRQKEKAAAEMVESPVSTPNNRMQK